MATFEARACDVCGRQDLNDIQRRLAFVGTLASINGTTVEAVRGSQQEPLDACSASCLHKALDAMIAEVTPQQTANVGA